MTQATTNTNTPLKHALLICLVGGLFYCMDYLIQVSPSVMIDRIMQHFHCNAQDIALLGSFFFYGYALMQLPAGMLLDRYGHRLILSIAMAVCGLSVCLFSLSNAFDTATIARFFIGASSAFSFIGTIALIRSYLPERYFATAVGSLQLLGAMGSIIGQAPLVILAHTLGWKTSLNILALALVVLALLLLLLQKNKHTQRPAITSKQTLTTYRSTLLSGRFWLLITCGMLCWVPVGTLGALWGVPYLKVHFHLSSVKASQLMIYFWLGLATTPILGRIADLTQKTPTLIIINFILATASAITLLHNHSVLISSIALYCLGLSCATQALTFQIARRWFAKSIFSGLCGLLNMAAIIGGGVSQYLTGFALHHQQPGAALHSSAYLLTTYQHALRLVPLCALLGILLSFWLYESHHTVAA